MKIIIFLKRGNFFLLQKLIYKNINFFSSKLYNRLKLMIFGGSNVGKTQLLQQLRIEGSITKKNLSSESWSRRMGHSPSKSSSKALNSKQMNISTSCVDVAEWTYEPKKGSKTSNESYGPIIFRTWDFDSKMVGFF